MITENRGDESMGMTKEEKLAFNMERWEFIRKLEPEEYDPGVAKSKRYLSWYKCRKCGKIQAKRQHDFNKNIFRCENKCHIIKRERKNPIRIANNKRWEYIRDLTSEEYQAIGVKTTTRTCLYKCKKCGEIQIIKRSLLGGKEVDCCNDCHTRRTTKNNCLATTHPHLVSYFVNTEDAHGYKATSRRTVKLRCPDCGHEKTKMIKEFVEHGVGCPYCSDGISYPEKYMANLFRNIGVDFKTQFTLDRGKHRYDFLVKGIIVEVHGGQHYEEGYRIDSRSFEEERENDILKYDLAVLNGYEYKKTYIVIDARSSDSSWIKQSVVNSGLLELLGSKAEDVDWVEVEKGARGSLVKKVCDYYNSSTTVAQVTREFKFSRPTVDKYLRIGNELGWCNYSTSKAKEVKPVRGVHESSGDVVFFGSVSEAERLIGVARPGIRACCRGTAKTAGGYTWSYITKDEYETLKKKDN